MSFSQKLKELRKENDLTQENLAKAICVSRTLITKYESGKVYPTENNLKSLAEYFNVEVKELISNEESTQMTLNVISWLNIFRITLFSLILALSMVFIVVLLLPIFKYSRYVDQIQTDLYGKASILEACQTLGIIVIIMSLLSIICSIVCIFKNKKNIYIISIIIFGFVMILFIFALISGLSIINSGEFSLNSVR